MADIVKDDKKNVLLLGTTSFFNDISGEALFTLLPLYIKNPGLLGILGGIISGFGDVIKVYFGYLSDHLGKRRVIVFLGYALSAVSKIIIPLVSSPLIIILLIFDRIGKGVREGPRDAILSFYKNKGWAFGLQKAMDTLGAVFGALLAYVAVTLALDFRTAMLVAASLGIFSLIPLLFVGHTHVDKNPEGFRETLKGVTKGMGWIVVVGSLFGLVMISPILLVREAYLALGSLGIIAYVFFNIIYSVSARAFGGLSDTLGRAFGMNLSFVSGFLGFFMVFLGGWWVALGFAFYGVSMGAFNSVSRALVGDLFTERKATAQGLFQTTTGIAVLVGSTLFGFGLSLIGRLVYLVYASFALLSVVAFNYWNTSQGLAVNP